MANILITGGTGSLGTAIVEQGLYNTGLDTFTVLARNESKIAKFKADHPTVRCEIGDVRDLAWLKTIVPGHDVCIHAAAIKQVPTAEVNVREAMMTNVVGSNNVAMACVEAGVQRVIGISTDKACSPGTIYGATKYLMEGLFREADKWSAHTRFILVRYGNVLRSNASVVPLFEKQIAENKPFTITKLDMTRFWLTMPQAIKLIKMAMSSDESGVIIVPRPPAMRMDDLARALDPSREIVEIGIRPGEKMHEELVSRSESLHTVEVKKAGATFYIIHPPGSIQSSQQFSYSSDRPSYWITPETLYEMLDAYNPNGGRVWSS